MNIARRLAHVHITTSQFLRLIEYTQTLFLVRQTPTNHDQALDGDSLLDLIADINAYNSDDVPAIIKPSLQTSLTTFPNDSMAMPVRNIKLKLDVDGDDPVLGVSQLIGLIRLFDEYCDDVGSMNEFVGMLADHNRLAGLLSEMPVGEARPN